MEKIVIFHYILLSVETFENRTQFVVITFIEVLEWSHYFV